MPDISAPRITSFSLLQNDYELGDTIEIQYAATDATGVDYVIFYYYDEANIQRKGSISFSNNSIVMECDSGSVRELQSPCAHCMRIFSIIASQAQSSALFRPSSGLCPSQAISPGPITTVFKPSPAKNPASVPNGTFVVPK
jgi:hypothetical protein